jgi:hypothetical protein
MQFFIKHVTCEFGGSHNGMKNSLELLLVTVNHQKKYVLRIVDRSNGHIQRRTDADVRKLETPRNGEPEME